MSNLSPHPIQDREARRLQILQKTKTEGKNIILHDRATECWMGNANDVRYMKTRPPKGSGKRSRGIEQNEHWFEEVRRQRETAREGMLLETRC